MSSWDEDDERTYPVYVPLPPTRSERMKAKAQKVIGGAVMLAVPIGAALFLAEHTWGHLGPHGVIPRGRLWAELAISCAVALGFACGVFVVLRWPRTFFARHEIDPERLEENGASSQAWMTFLGLTIGPGIIGVFLLALALYGLEKLGL